MTNVLILSIYINLALSLSNQKNLVCGGTFDIHIWVDMQPFIQSNINKKNILTAKRCHIKR